MNYFAVAIFGPTGVGKTSLALKLTENIGEIISVDSMQVYKYMDIGTAKPTSDELDHVKHHLIDIITPDIQFTAGDFKRSAQKIIPDIIKKKKIPFLVGGTGLYFLSLMRGMVDIPVIDKKIRDYINDKWQKLGQKEMYNLLKINDNDYAKIIHPNDKQRTLRALEVITFTGNKFSYYLNKDNNRKDYKYITIGINIERKKLYDIINARVDKMLEEGFIDEVKKLLDMGYNKNNPGMRAIGYKEIIEYLNNERSIEDTIDLIKRNSRRYAKRQLTWFNKVDNVKWFNNCDYDKIKMFIDEKLLEISKNN